MRLRLAAVGATMVVLAVAGLVGHLASAHESSQFFGGLDSESVLPVGPMAHVSMAPYPGAPGEFGTTLFILGADSVRSLPWYWPR